MKVDLSFLHDEINHLSLEEDIELPSITYRHQEIGTPYLFHLNLDIYLSDDTYIITGKLTGKIILKCSRCIEPFDYHLDLKINEEVDQEETEDGLLDLIDLLIENILLHIPIKPICDEECQGLCSVCGQNLNEGTCDCDQEVVDPRLAKLKEFLND